MKDFFYITNWKPITQIDQNESPTASKVARLAIEIEKTLSFVDCLKMEYM